MDMLKIKRPLSIVLFGKNVLGSGVFKKKFTGERRVMLSFSRQ